MVHLHSRGTYLLMLCVLITRFFLKEVSLIPLLIHFRGSLYYCPSMSCQLCSHAHRPWLFFQEVHKCRVLVVAELQRLLLFKPVSSVRQLFARNVHSTLAWKNLFLHTWFVTNPSQPAVINHNQTFIIKSRNRKPDLHLRVLKKVMLMFIHTVRIELLLFKKQSSKTKNFTFSKVECLVSNINFMLCTVSIVHVFSSQKKNKYFTMPDF